MHVAIRIDIIANPGFKGEKDRKREIRAEDLWDRRGTMAGIEIKDGKIYVDGKLKKLEEQKKVSGQALSDQELEQISGAGLICSSVVDNFMKCRCGRTKCKLLVYENELRVKCFECGRYIAFYTSR